jgi:hypothetical protein
MKAWIMVVACLGIILMTTGVEAQSAGRFQAILLQPGSIRELPNVLILDTVEGHLWLWHQEATSVPKKAYEPVKVETFINYQGKLRPGKAMGELMEKW